MYQIIIVTITIVLFIILLYVNRSLENTILKGFWKGGAGFCNESELDLFLLYIGEGTYNTSGYILAKNNEGIIMNNNIKFKLKPNFSINPFRRSRIDYKILIDWMGEEGYDFFPDKQELYYYPHIGKLVFVSNDETKAVLYKDNETNDISNKMPENVYLDTGEDI